MTHRSTDTPRWYASVHSDACEPFLVPELPSLDEEVTIRLRCAPDTPVERVLVRAILDGIDHHFEAVREDRGSRFAWYAARFVLSQPATHYHFTLRGSDGVTRYYNRLGVSDVFPNEDHDFTINTAYRPPRWVSESVFYQIFPDRFHRGDPRLGVSDGEISRDGFASRAMPWDERPLPWSEGGALDFFNGDLPGIEAKLDYLHDLGINALYLTPIFRAKTNHRYDCLDYFEVDEHLGGDAALASLIASAHARGIRVMLDVSINHVGVEHEWANGVEVGGRRVDFVQRDGDGSIVNWMGVRDLLKLDYSSDDLRDVIYRCDGSAVRRYLREPFGIDAWRFDVASETGNYGAHQQGHDVWREIRKVVREERADAYIVGEHWHDASAYLQGDQWDSAMNYFASGRIVRMWLGEQDRFAVAPSAEAVVGRPITGGQVSRLIDQHFARIPSGAVHAQFNLVDSHDVTRVHNHADVFSWPTYAGAVALLFMLPGTACVYYGDEVGIDGTLDGDHGKRFPMPWDESRWDARFVALYRSLIVLKRSSRALQRGSYRVLDAGESHMVFARFTTGEAVVLVLNRSPEERDFAVDLGPIGVSSVDALSHVGIDERPGAAPPPRLEGQTLRAAAPPATSLIAVCSTGE